MTRLRLGNNQVKTTWRFIAILTMLTIGVGNAWGTAAVNSQAPANGKSFIIALYYSSEYYALPHITSTNTYAGKQCTLDANGKVTAIADCSHPDECLWTFAASSTNWKISYENSGTYYLQKSGTTGKTNYKIQANTTNDDSKLWSFTSGTANSKTAYYMSCAYSSATQNKTMQGNSSSTFQVRTNNTIYAITLLEVAPIITCATTSLSGFTYVQGSGPSAAQSFSVSGSHLTANITVTAPTNYEVSTSSGSGYGSSVTLTKNASGAVSATTVYVRLKSGLSAGSYTGTSITMTSTGAANKTISLSGSVTASCGGNPTAGSASLNGSISLSSFPVQTTGWTVGSNCAWTDFGFVWSSSVSTPTLESNGTASSGCTKIQKATDGTSTSATHSITGSFSTGNSYYVRGYGKNGYASGSYQYTSVLTITPRSVTFDLNGHGSSAPSTQYVNNGAKATDPSYSESVTGWTFGGWYKEDGCSNAWTFGTDVVSGGNKTLYAKWTAKTTTVSFNQNSGTGGQTGTLTATYGSAMPGAPVTCPTRTGYNFGGYYDGPGGTGTQYYTNAGASARSWDKDAATATLYAKWTAKSFTVTWMVNGVAYTPSGSGGTDGSSSVNFGTHVTTLPTAPTPPCGDKFVGWSTTNIGAVGLDKDDDADDITALNLFTTAGSAPTISAEGNVTYYAVFADYDE